MSAAPADEWDAKVPAEPEELGYDVILVPDTSACGPFPALVAAAGPPNDPGWAVRHRRGLLEPRAAGRGGGDHRRPDRRASGARARHRLRARGARHRRAGLRLAEASRWTTCGAPWRSWSGCWATRSTCPGPRSGGVPLLIGANGDRMLELTARHADFSAFTGGRTVRGTTTGLLAPITAGELDERVARYRELAAGRGNRRS